MCLGQPQTQQLYAAQTRPLKGASNHPMPQDKPQRVEALLISLLLTTIIQGKTQTLGPYSQHKQNVF